MAGLLGRAASVCQLCRSTRCPRLGALLSPPIPTSSRVRVPAPASPPAPEASAGTWSYLSSPHPLKEWSLKLPRGEPLPPVGGSPRVWRGRKPSHPGSGPRSHAPRSRLTCAQLSVATGLDSEGHRRQFAVPQSAFHPLTLSTLADRHRRLTTAACEEQGAPAAPHDQVPIPLESQYAPRWPNCRVAGPAHSRAREAASD